MSETRTSPILHTAHWRRLVGALLSTDGRRRIRITHWLISALVYACTIGVLWFGALNEPEGQGLLYWTCFVLLGEAFFYGALRSGWSERFADPAMTTAQILFGVATVDLGYLICGPIRTVALLPLLLIFAFGAFSLGWRRIVLLTACALASLFVTIAVLHASRAGSTWTLGNPDLRLDVTNFLMTLILLPALSLVAARLSELRSRLRAQREALTAALREVERLATHDELTGLANRRHAQIRMEQEQQRFMRTRQPFSVAIIDIDHFKAVNDALGHAGGDDVLKSFATNAGKALRACDLLARWGGEEFLVLLPNTTGSQAHATLQRIQADVGGGIRDANAGLTFSAGVAEYRPGEPLAELISRADDGMYQAKHSGRNQVVLASPGPFTALESARA